MTASDSHERHDVYYQGRVQGVGFRYTVRQLAARFNLTGFVQNLRDGRVRLVVEGDPSETMGLLRAIEDELGHYVTNTRDECTPATGSFHGFEIHF